MRLPSVTVDISALIQQQLLCVIINFRWWPHWSTAIPQGYHYQTALSFGLHVSSRTKGLSHKATLIMVLLPKTAPTIPCFSINSLIPSNSRGEPHQHHYSTTTI